jgi:hypothetical protein
MNESAVETVFKILRNKFPETGPKRTLSGMG